MNEPTAAVPAEQRAVIDQTHVHQPEALTEQLSDIDDADIVSGTTAEPEGDGLPNIGPADISQLEIVGFNQARQTIFGVAVSAQNIDSDVFAATMELGGRMLAREKLVDTPDEVLDSIETDLAVMRAVDKFRKVIKDIGERQAARAAVRVPQPSPDELLAAAAAAAPGVGQ